MRSAYAAAMLGIAALLGGCGQGGPVYFGHPALLFDRDPGYVSASGFERSDRRVAPADGAPYVYYREFYLDHQGEGFRFHDHVHRRFMAIREGHGRR